MAKQNLTELFNFMNLDIQIKAIQIVYLYHVIKKWYIKNTIQNVDSIDYRLIDNNDHLDDIYYRINGTYISLVYPQSPEQINNDDKNCIKSIEQLKSLSAVYIRTDKNVYISLLYDYHQKVLLIDVNTLNIIEFSNIAECINHVDMVNSRYTYQLLKVVNRLFS
jgi:hypothetical protein